MIKQETPKSRLWISCSQVLLYLLLALGSVIMIFPFIWMILSTLKASGEIIAYPPVWIPKQPSFERYVYIFKEAKFGLFFMNSIFISTTVTSIQLLTSGMIGYVLAKYHFRGRNILFLGILSIMMIPEAMFLLPKYEVVSKFGMIDTYWVLIIPGLFNPFGIFLMRQFSRTIPDALLDAARIDGCTEIGIFFRIAMPLCKAAFSVLGIFVFIGVWNDLLWPLVVLNSEKLFTLPLGLARFTSEHTVNYGMTLTGATVTVIPVLIIFLIFQRRFIEGITLTGLKG